MLLVRAGACVRAAISDVNRLFPGLLVLIREWLRTYKVPEGKAVNKFASEQPYDKVQFMSLSHHCYCCGILCLIAVLFCLCLCLRCTIQKVALQVIANAHNWWKRLCQRTVDCDSKFALPPP